MRRRVTVQIIIEGPIEASQLAPLDRDPERSALKAEAVSKMLRGMPAEAFACWVEDKLQAFETLTVVKDEELE